MLTLSTEFIVKEILRLIDKQKGPGTLTDDERRFYPMYVEELAERVQKHGLRE